MNIRKLLTKRSVALIILVALLIISACGRTDQTSGELEKVILGLDWVPGAQHAPFYVGKANGYYSEEGIDLEIIVGSGSPDSVKRLGSNTVDIAIVDGLVLVQAIEQRVPIKAVGVYFQRTPISITSRIEKPIKSPADLLGDVTLGSAKGSATHQGLVALLSANQMSIEQVNLVDIGFGIEPFLVGSIDAAMTFTNVQPPEAELAGVEIHELFIADWGVQNYGLSIASSDRFIQQHPDLLEGFLRATKKAMEEVLNNNNTAIDIVDQTVEEFDKERGIKVLERTIPFWISDDTNNNGFLWQTGTGWEHTINTALTLEVIESVPNVNDVYTSDFLK